MHQKLSCILIVMVGTIGGNLAHRLALSLHQPGQCVRLKFPVPAHWGNGATGQLAPCKAFDGLRSLLMPAAKSLAEWH
jgi:hypothetical protein